MKNRKLILFSLLLIFLIGLFLRLYHLHLNLPELYIDETFGQFMMRLSIIRPDLKLSSLIQTYFYNTLSFTSIFGFDPFGARFASALFSALLPLSTFFLFNQVKHSHKVLIALLGAFLVAILPWSFLIGRIAHVHIPIIVSLSCLSAVFYLHAKKNKHYLFSLVCLAIAAFYYPSIIFITPFVTFLVVLEISKKLSRNQRKQLYLIIAGLVLIVLGIFIFKYQGFNPTSRGVDLAIWRDPNTVYDTNQNRGLSWLSAPTLFTFSFNPRQFAPLVYNKLTANLAIFTRNYLSFFSPDWLFLHGDDILRHSTGQMGYFFPVLLPFLIFGIYRFFKEQKQRTQLIFLIWILSSPLSAALTRDGAGYLLRVITIFPFLTYFIVLGIIDFYVLLNYWVYKLVYSLTLIVLISYSAFYFYFGYFHVYPYQTSTARAYEYGFKALSDFQVEQNNAPLLIIWDGYYPYGHFLFWQNVSPSEYTKHEFEDIVINNSHFYHPLRNLYFVKPYDSNDIQEFIKIHQPDFLVLPDPYYVKYPAGLIPDKPATKTITYPDGTTNFTIYSL